MWAAVRRNLIIIGVNKGMRTVLAQAVNSSTASRQEKERISRPPIHINGYNCLRKTVVMNRAKPINKAFV